MNIMETMIEAIESLSNKDINNMIESLENLQTVEQEHKRNLCESILLNMIKQYDDVFYRR